MIINFADAAYECRALHLTTGRFKINDLILIPGQSELLQVKTVQADCMGWGKNIWGYGNESFTALICESENGREQMLRNIKNCMVWRPKKKVT